MKKYLLKPLAVTALGSLIIISSASNAAAATTITKVNQSAKLVKGKVIKKSTNKAYPGYVSFKGKVYKAGSLFTGLISKKYYKKGVLSTGTYAKKYYVKGALFTGVKNKKYYKKGVLTTGIYKAKYYKKGLLSTGMYKRKYYVKGLLFNGLKNNKFYKNGVLSSGTYKDVVYVKGLVDQIKTALLQFKKNNRTYEDLLDIKKSLLTIADHNDLLVNPTLLPEKNDKLQTKSNLFVGIDPPTGSVFLNIASGVLTRAQLNDIAQMQPSNPTINPALFISHVNSELFPTQQNLLTNFDIILQKITTDPELLSQMTQLLKKMQEDNNNFLGSGAQPAVAVGLQQQIDTMTNKLPPLTNKLPPSPTTSKMSMDQIAIIIKQIPWLEGVSADAYGQIVLQKLNGKLGNTTLTIETNDDEIEFMLNNGDQSLTFSMLSLLTQATKLVNNLFTGEHLSSKSSNSELLLAKNATSKLSASTTKESLLQRIALAESLFVYKTLLIALQGAIWTTEDNSDEVANKIKETIRGIPGANLVSISPSNNQVTIQVTLGGNTQNMTVNAPWLEAENAVTSAENSASLNQEMINTSKTLVNTVQNTTKKQELTTRLNNLQERLAREQQATQNQQLFNRLVQAASGVIWGEEDNPDSVEKAIREAVQNENALLFETTDNAVTVTISYGGHTTTITLSNPNPSL
ncbi:hypothetical protein [Kurthia sibirica]|uniref:Uncharacterized protein n=1 Tax=Kurthia sibirica TaxID=202750 RepID=A0A2U3AEQ4_9BACL|nr:hypothetical protein [Kurthia sibirica]PWI23026.1 hypothetical protein DEX24_16475 [Kurthia sibirica]GEK35555.1 hypothetical protein KSI01_30880 [Kurthia sibirica]